MVRAATRKRSMTGDDERAGASFLSRLGSLVRSLFIADDDEEPSQHAREVLGIAMIFASIWLFVSLISIDADRSAAENWGGRLGFYLAKYAHATAGAAGHVYAFLGLCWGVVLVTRKSVPKAGLRLFAAIAFTLSLAFLLNMGLGSGDLRRDSSGTRDERLAVAESPSDVSPDHGPLPLPVCKREK